MAKKKKDSNFEKSFKDKWGTKSIERGNSLKKRIYSEDEFLSTGSYQLNRALSGHHRYGLKKGRLVEIYGPYSSGKTTAALHVAAEATQRKMKVGFHDCEHALQPSYAEDIGVDLDYLHVVKPYCAEDSFEMAWDMLEGGIGLIIFDSIPSMLPRAFIDTTMDDKNMGLHAKTIGDGMKKAAKLFDEAGSYGIFINQIRMKIGVFFGNPETTPGGEGKNFYFTHRIDFRANRGDKITGKEEDTGPVDDTGIDPEEEKILKSRMSAIGKRKALKKLRTKKKKSKGKIEIGIMNKFTVVKNKIFPPFRSGKIKVNYGRGIDKVDDRLCLFNEMGIIEFESGKKTLKYNGKGITVAKFETKLKEPKFRAKIKEEVDNFYK